jgi:hypothetical protein
MMDWKDVGGWLKANAGPGAALVGSLLYSLCALVIDMAMEALFSRREG